ncbi:hypothetical protein AAIH38_33305, partial [Pseudomonas aeruginosa]|uniref:hypothetical protein n=1 Tax=Pseudomonas aeruginosa TaxID=287 RepID=UPI0031B72A66
MNLDSKLFDATLDLERVKVSVRTLVKLSRQEQSAIIRTLNGNNSKYLAANRRVPHLACPSL